MVGRLGGRGADGRAAARLLRLVENTEIKGTTPKISYSYLSGSRDHIHWTKEDLAGFPPEGKMGKIRTQKKS